MRILPNATTIEIVKNYEFQPCIKRENKYFKIKKSVIFTLSLDKGIFTLNIEDRSKNKKIKKSLNVQLLTFLNWQQHSFYLFKSNLFVNISELFEMFSCEEQDYIDTFDQSLFKYIAKRILISITYTEQCCYEITLTIRGTKFIASRYLSNEDFLPFIE